MYQSYPVYLDSDVVGAAYVEKQGLYYQFHCKCNFSHPAVYTITAECGNCRENLGICVPYENGFVLKTRVPVKRFQSSQITFTAALKDSKERRRIPVCGEKPFPNISELENGRHCIENENHYIIFGRENCCPETADSEHS